MCIETDVARWLVAESKQREEKSFAFYGLWSGSPVACGTSISTGFIMCHPARGGQRNITPGCSDVRYSRASSVVFIFKRRGN